MSRSLLNQQRHARQVYACWLGKNIGGTLGGPYEGRPGPLDLSFYDPVPTGALPNDDLDLQLVWLHHLRTTRSREVTPEILGEAWIKHVTFPFDEYGVSLRNAALSLDGMSRGATDNFFGEGMGAAIRSEIWACLAPGDPARAAGFSWADAVNDHCGEGVWAEVFFAALQSAAFEEKNTDILLDWAVAFLPVTSEIRHAIGETRAHWAQSNDWRDTRAHLIRLYARANFTHVTINVAFTVLGWLAGAGDFGRSLCIAVNCGYDTDCTGATLGALLGIIDPSCIPSRWRTPVGESVVVSAPIIGITPPLTLSELTSQTLELAEQLREARPRLGTIAPCLPQGAEDAPWTLKAKISHLANFDAEPAVTETQALVLPGHWTRWRRDDFQARALELELSFRVPSTGRYLVMAYAETELRCQVDDQPAFGLSGDDLRRDVYAAPSPHRAGPFGRTFELSVGTHRLRLRLQRPAAATFDLVIAVANPQTHQWIPDAFTAESISGHSV